MYVIKKIYNTNKLIYNSNKLYEYNTFSFYSSLLLSFLIFFINPFYIIILGAILETISKLKKFTNFFLAASLSLSFSNREIGNPWFSNNGIKAEDDAINYIDFYQNINFHSYIFDLKNYLYNFLNGQEPVWFYIAEISGFLSKYNNNFIVFVSVAIPIFILHHTFKKTSNYFCFNALIFYTLIPEIFHSIYHLWRFSLSSSITYLAFITTLNTNKVNYKLLILAILTHFTSFLILLGFLITKYLKFDINYKYLVIKNIYKRTIKIFINLAIFIFIFYFFFLIFQLFDLNKFYFYFGGNYTEKFVYNSRHVLYFLISIFFVYYSNNKYIYIFALLNILLISIPFFFPLIGIFIERFLIITVPLLALTITFYFNNVKPKIFYIIPFIVLFFYLKYNLENQLFYKYISNNNFFSFYNGIIYNILYRF